MKNLKKSIFFFLFESYHRPKQKIHHIFAFLDSFRYLKKSRTFSERIFLLKFPPLSTLYYNSFGRFLFLISNFLFIIFTGKFLEKDLKLENTQTSDNKSQNLNSRPWPQQSILELELKEEKQLSENFFNKIEKNYNFSSSQLNEDSFFSESNWWRDCRLEFEEIFMKSGKIEKKNLENFRNDMETKAEILSDQNFISKKNSNFINKLKTLSLVNLYHKYAEHVDLNVLRMTSESVVGKNYCPIYRGQRIGHRILRYTYYLSQINKHTDLIDSKSNLVLDIGGGYGGLTRVLKHYFTKSTFVIVELPELCLLSSYFLKKCFPSLKIGFFEDFKNLDKISANDLKKFDFVILTPPFIKKFDSEIFDLIINTTSLGEMTDNMQEFYISNIERITNNYFYSVNRASKRIEKYNSKGFYDLKFKKRWISKIYKYTHTYHIEFLGKKL